MFASHRSFCSAEPWASRVGPARLRPTRLTSCGARTRAYSPLKIATCTGDAPRPPYSAGQWRPTQPPAPQPALPLAAPLDFVVESGEDRDLAEVGGKPRPHLVG